MSIRDNDGWEIVSAKKSQNTKSNESPSTSSNDNDTPTWLANYIQIRTNSTPNNITDLHQNSSSQSSLSILLLIGLPGSGKSTFANALEKLVPWKYIVVNQDQLKTRQKVLDNTKKFLLDQHNKKCVIIDRCNFDYIQRRHFFELIESISKINENQTKDKNEINNISSSCERQVDSYSSATVNIPIDCIVFDIDAKICEQRCLTRRNHPTLKKQDVLKVIRMMQKSWIPPNSKNEHFRHITTITNDHEFQSKLISMIESES